MERGVNRLLYFVRGESGGEVRFPFELWRAQTRNPQGPPQPMNVILTDMNTKNACKSPVKASAFDVGEVRTRLGLQGLTVRD